MGRGGLWSRTHLEMSVWSFPEQQAGGEKRVAEQHVNALVRRGWGAGPGWDPPVRGTARGGAGQAGQGHVSVVLLCLRSQAELARWALVRGTSPGGRGGLAHARGRGSERSTMLSGTVSLPGGRRGRQRPVHVLHPAPSRPLSAAWPAFPGSGALLGLAFLLMNFRGPPSAHLRGPTGDRAAQPRAGRWDSGHGRVSEGLDCWPRVQGTCHSTVSVRRFKCRSEEAQLDNSS